MQEFPKKNIGSELSIQDLGTEEPGPQRQHPGFGCQNSGSGVLIPRSQSFSAEDLGLSPQNQSSSFVSLACSEALGFMPRQSARLGSEGLGFSSIGLGFWCERQGVSSEGDGFRPV